MKHLQQTTSLLLAATLALSSLNSCYFNSAGHLFDKASHKEAVNTFEMKPGHYLYYNINNGYFFLELPRYKTAKPISTQYDPLSLCSNMSKIRYSEHIVKVPGERITVRISRKFAMYLLGEGDTSYHPTASDMAVVQNQELNKNLCQVYTIRRSPGSLIKNYTYQSPNRIGWVSLGVLDWLCVDLPITCVENSLALAFTIVGWPVLIEAMVDSPHANTITKSVVPNGWYITQAGTAVAGSPKTSPSENRARMDPADAGEQNTPPVRERSKISDVTTSIPAPENPPQSNLPGASDPGWDDSAETSN